MHEHQGNLTPNLSGLPGPRPFDKKSKDKVKMEDNKKQIDDIVARTAAAIGSGRSFGGWTDKNESFATHIKKQEDAVGTPWSKKKKKSKQPLGEIVSPDKTGPSEVLGLKIPDPRTYADKKRDKSGTLQGLMTPKQKGTKSGKLSEEDKNLPRQLKDPNKEALVVKNRKVVTIDKKDLKKKLSQGWQIATEDKRHGTTVGGRVSSKETRPPSVLNITSKSGHTEKVSREDAQAAADWLKLQTKKKNESTEVNEFLTTAAQLFPKVAQRVGAKAAKIVGPKAARVAKNVYAHPAGKWGTDIGAEVVGWTGLGKLKDMLSSKKKQRNDDVSEVAAMSVNPTDRKLETLKNRTLAGKAAATRGAARKTWQDKADLKNFVDQGGA